MLKKDYPTGVILFEGKSRLDGGEIAVIATGLRTSNNHKTGDMIQVWILSKDVHPCEAKRNGADFSICGDCKHRHFKSCYVEMLRGPVTIWNYYKKGGSYVKYDKKKHLELFRNRYIRFGAYGDPVAVPFVSLEKICQVAAGWTGYTHQWHTSKAKKYKKYLMASVDSMQGYYNEVGKAQKMGWRTFRSTTLDDNVIFHNEFICPASKEAGKLLTCEDCGACKGAFSARPNPVIKIHGFKYKLMNFTKGMKKIKNKKAWKREFKKNEAPQCPVIPLSFDRPIESIELVGCC